MPQSRRPFPCARQQLPEPTRFDALDSRSAQHHQIEAAQIFDFVAKALPNLALQPMTSNRPRHDAAPDCETEPRAIQRVETGNHSHSLGVQAGAAGEYPREIPPPSEPTVSPQAPVGANLIRQRADYVPLRAER